MTTSSRISRAMLTRGGALVLVAFAITLWIAPEHVPDGEAAEFSVLGSRGGVAHPPGYPLYLMYLRLTSWLPGATAGHTAAIATAILGALQLLVLHAACRAWGARPLAATVAVAIYAAAPAVLRYHSQAEVFALNGFAVATILWLAAKAGPLGGERRVIALGLVAGLGIANHHTCVLIAPVGLYGVVLGVRETPARFRAALLGVAALAVGLTPYAYLLATADNRASWAPIDDLGTLLAHFLREDYGGSGSFMPGAAEPQPTANLVALGKTLGRAWLWLPLLGALAALVVRAWRSSDGAIWAWRMLALSWLLAGPLLVLRFNIDPTGIGRYIVERFHLLSILLLVIPVAIAVDRAGARIATRVVGLTRPAVGLSLAVAVHLALVTASSPRLAQLRSPALERAMENLLTSMPPDAVVLASGDASHNVVTYLQLAEGLRPDVTVVTWAMVPWPWYRARLATRGIVFDGPSKVPSVELVNKLLDSRRAVFVDLSMGKVLDAFSPYPYGIVFRVVPRGEAGPSIEQVFSMNKKLLEGFRLDYPTPGPDDFHATLYQNQYVIAWRLIGNKLAAEHPDDAAWAYAAADTLAPK